MSDDKGWYYLRDGGSVGPENSKQILELLDAGAVLRTTLVWCEGAPDWQPLEIALGLTRNAPPPVPGATPPGMPPIPKASSTRDFLKGTSPVPDDMPHPWRRYFARMLDVAVGGALMFFALGFVLAALDQDASKEFVDWVGKPDNRVLNSLLTIAIAMLPIGLCIGFTGSSLGKWIFGISVSKPDGTPIGLKTALHRELMIWLKGLGLGIPLVSLITLVTAFRTLKENKESSWDSDLGLVVTYRPPTTRQMIFNVVGVALLLFVLMALLVLQSA